MPCVEIRVKGRLAEHWSSWFEDLTIVHAGDETILSGEVADQAALYGLLARLRDLGLALTAVSLEEAPPTPSGEPSPAQSRPEAEYRTRPAAESPA